MRTQSTSKTTTFTRSQLTQPDGLLQACILGIAANLVYLVSYSYGDTKPILAGISACLLYTSSIFSPLGASLIAISIFSVTVLLQTDDPFTALRIILFALALSSIFKKKPLLPPYIIHYSLWFIFLLVLVTLSQLNTLPHLETAVKHASNQLAANLLVEQLGVLILGLLMFSSGVNTLFQKRHPVVPSSLFFTHLILFSTIVLILASALVGAIASNLSASMFFYHLIHLSLPSIILLLGLLGIPLFLSTYFTRVLTTGFQTLVIAGQKEHPLLDTKQQRLALMELRDSIRDAEIAVSKREALYREAQETIRELRLEAKIKENEIYERELQAKNLSMIMNQSPWGFMACNANGLIISANETFCQTMRLDQHKIQGALISTIETRHPWWREIVSVVNETCRDFQRLIGANPIIRYTSTVDQQYAEIIIQVRISPELARGEFSVADEIASRDAAVLCSFRIVPDFRDFQSDLLRPMGYELIGSQAAEYYKQLNGQLAAIVGHVSILSGVLNNLQDAEGIPFRQTEPGIEMSESLREIDTISRKAVAELQELELRQFPNQGEIVKLNFSQRLVQLIQFLKELLPGQDFVTVQVLDSSSTASDVNGKKLEPSKSPGIYLDGALHEVTKFFAYSLNFIRALRSRIKHLSITIGYEKIEQDTAHIIPGSLPGHYVRLVLSHDGQSISPNMISAKLSRFSNVDADVTSPELALSYLYHQINRLGGFMSVQSTSTKGTNITIYLPTEPSDQKKMVTKPHKSQKHFHKQRFLDVQTSGNDVLLISTDQNTAIAATNMLRHLGYNVTTERTDLFLEELNAPVDFHGSGFDDKPTSGGSGGVEDDLLHYSNTKMNNSFDIIILDVERSPQKNLPLIHHLEKHHRDAAILLLADPQADIKRLFSDWAVLAKPFDMETMASAIKNALSKM